MINTHKQVNYIPLLKRKCWKERGRMKEKAGKRGWILFGVSVPHTQTERPQAPDGGVGDRRWGGCSDDQLPLINIILGGRVECSRTIDSKDVKGRFVISHRRRNIGNQKKRQIKWHRTLTPRREWWTDMMVAKRENCKTTIESLDHHMVDQRIVTRRWWSGDQTYSRQSPALIRFSQRRRYSLHHLPTTPSTPNFWPKCLILVHEKISLPPFNCGRLWYNRSVTSSNQKWSANGKIIEDHQETINLSFLDHLRRCKHSTALASGAVVVQQ